MAGLQSGEGAIVLVIYWNAGNSAKRIGLTWRVKLPAVPVPSGTWRHARDRPILK